MQDGPISKQLELYMNHYGAEWPLGAAAPSEWSRICTIYYAPGREISVDACSTCHIFQCNMSGISLDDYLNMDILVILWNLKSD